MMNDPRGKGLQAKQEGQRNKNNNNDGNLISNTSRSYNKAGASSSNTTTTSRQWSGFRNPRIVRVSRTFGGKDRHSKVSTVRGLRDRRIRLSVPTAIQLYELQDKLGLNQPSKVIDWLLEVTDDDIEKLPPLQLLPHHGLLNTTSALNSHQQLYQQQQLLNSLNVPFYDVNRRLSEQVELENRKGKSINRDEDEALLGRKLFPLGNAVPSSIPGLLNNAMSYNNNYFHHQNQEPDSCLSLSQFGSNHGFPIAPHQMDQTMMINNGLPFSYTPVLPSLFGSYDHHQPQLSNVLLPSSLQYSIGSSLRSFPTLESLKLHTQNNHTGGSSSQPNKDDSGS